MRDYLAPFKDFLTLNNVFFIILILLILKGLSQVTVIALLFFAGYVIAASLNPITDKLAKKMNRGLAATIVLCSTLAIVFAVFVPIFYIAGLQIKSLINILPAHVNTIVDYVLNTRFFGHSLTEFVNIDNFISSFEQVAKTVLSQSINITLTVFQSVLFFMVICMLVYYFMADKEIIKNGLMKLIPQDLREKSSVIYDNIFKNVGGYVIAQLLTMAAVGALTAVGMFFLGVDYSLLLGLFTGVFDIIPIIGPTIALILCLIMAYQLGALKLILVVIVFITAQWISNNLVRPVIFGRFLNLHPLVVILSLLLAAQFLGIWGVFLAPAIASLIWVLFDELYIKTINKSE